MTRRTRDGDFQLATSGDLNPATCGYFYMATDTRSGQQRLVAHHQEFGILGHLTPGQRHQTAEQTAREQADDQKITQR